MGVIKAQVTLKTDDANPENYVSNSFAIMGTDPLANVVGITDEIRDFYNALSMTWYGATVAANGHTVKYYDMPGVKPNYPIAEHTFNLTINPANAPLPTEIAVCLSFQGAKTPGFPQARRRGRIYLGPLAASVNVDGRPNETFITHVCTAALAFKSGIEGLSGNEEWCVWSGTNETGVDITNGWVDNAFDVQRRRGLAPSIRQVW